ncbi:MAG: GAF domain-containing protein [Ardenticatenaceae bacterium]|nr:GAF domain-containing protein [Ardenticatenaceae bacterium]MCB8986829.1 GAF domain-containing protein [Ardenticatenaceae bacterium]
MKEQITALVKKEFQRLQWLSFAILVLAFFILVAAFYYVVGVLLGNPLTNWMTGLVITSLLFLGVTVIIFALMAQADDRLTTKINRTVYDETHDLEAANKRLKSLQELASIMRATLSFERVVEEALNVCNQALIDSGTPRESLISTVFLFAGETLRPVATRSFSGSDLDRRIPGKRGIVGKALRDVVVTVSNNVERDPEIRTFSAFRSCQIAICIPLRAGFNIFGAMLIASKTAVQLNEEHYELFSSVADQAVISLQNARLYQELDAEKQRLIDANENARKELARDLHDGPTQSIAAIAMRINFIRSLVTRDPDQAIMELQKVEELAKQTSKEIRGMLFTLRPLILETQGLQAAIETVITRLRETDGLNVQLNGGEHANLLDDAAQSVVFSIVEEALGNARKYSQANQIEVRFWKEENLFVARIQDDGVGFDTQDVNRDYSSRGSLGMVNMRERAERIDGSLRVESTPKQGTTITLVVPLEKHGRPFAAGVYRKPTTTP